MTPPSVNPPSDSGPAGPVGPVGPEGAKGAKGETGPPRGERRRFDPIHLLAYVILAAMFTFSQSDVTRQATKACESVNEVKQEIKVVLSTLVDEKQQKLLRQRSEELGLELFRKESC